MFQSKVYVNKEIETDPILKAKKLKISVEIIADYQNLKKLKPISYCLLTISANYRFVSSHLICCHLWGLWHIIIFSNLILTNFPCFPTYATYVAERPLKNNQNELEIMCWPWKFEKTSRSSKSANQFNFITFEKIVLGKKT